MWRTRRKTRERRLGSQGQKTFTKELLICIATTAADGLTLWLDAAIGPRLVFDELREISRRRQSREFEQYLRQALYNLERQKCLTRKKIGKRICLALTEKGSMRILREQLKSGKKYPQGTYTIVFFDIPENLRHVRQLFRRLLKDGEFRQWQRSVWVSERDVSRTIGQFIKNQRIAEWVTVCVTKSIVGVPAS